MKLAEVVCPYCHGFQSWGHSKDGEPVLGEMCPRCVAELQPVYDSTTTGEAEKTGWCGPTAALIIASVATLGWALSKLLVRG
jgi:hypothetical protein